MSLNYHESKRTSAFIWRAGFGLNPKQFDVSNKSRKYVVNNLFENSKSVSPLKVDLSFLDGITPVDLKNNPELAKELREKSRKKNPEP